MTPAPPTPDTEATTQLLGRSGPLAPQAERKALVLRERLYRYIARPAVTEKRLSANAQGKVVQLLKALFGDRVAQVMSETSTLIGLERTHSINPLFRSWPTAKASTDFRRHNGSKAIPTVVPCATTRRPLGPAVDQRQRLERAFGTGNGDQDDVPIIAPNRKRRRNATIPVWAACVDEKPSGIDTPAGEPD